MNKKNPTQKRLLILTATFLLSMFFISCSEQNENAITNPTTDEATLNKEVNQVTFGFTSRIDRLAEYLELTDDQVAQLKEFVEKQRAELKNEFRKNRHKGKRNKAEMLKIRKKLREDFQVFMDSILTDEQKAKYEELKQKIKSGEFSEERLADWIAKLAIELNLTDEQQTQLKDVLKNRIDAVKAFKEEKHNRKELFDFMKKLRADTKAELEKILTPEQMKKFEELVKNRFLRFGHHNS